MEPVFYFIFILKIVSLVDKMSLETQNLK